MTVVAAVGLPGSGKSEAGALASEMGLHRISMGDVVRRRVEERGLEPTDDNIADVSRDLRAERGGDAVAQLCVEELDAVGGDVFVDGIRGWNEVRRFRNELDEGVVVLAIEAPLSTRFERIADRQRAEDVETLRELAARDRRELDWGMDRALTRADVTIRNDGSLESFREAVRTAIAQAVGGD